MRYGCSTTTLTTSQTHRVRIALFTAAFTLLGCAPGTVPHRPGCVAGAPYIGPPFAPAFDRSAFPATRIDWTAALPAVVQARLADVWEGGIVGTGATVASVTVARIADGARVPGVWSARIGPREPQPFWWGSVGKMATASIIMQMEAEGALSLDDTVERWFPDYPGAETLTLEHLLTHTGGVHSFDRDAALRGRQDFVSPERLIAASARRGLDFCPGTNWLYSNTGYVMLSRIVERVDGAPLSKVVARRVAAPIGATTMLTLGPETDPGALVAPVGRLEGAVQTFATTGGAGPVAGGADDMVRLLEAFATGRLAGINARDGAVARLVPMFSSTASYGRGIMVIDVPGDGGTTRWIGHTGGSPDAKAVAVYDTRRRTYVGMLLNTDVDAERLALALLQALD